MENPQLLNNFKERIVCENIDDNSEDSMDFQNNQTNIYQNNIFQNNIDQTNKKNDISNSDQNIINQTKYFQNNKYQKKTSFYFESMCILCKIKQIKFKKIKVYLKKYLKV